MLLQHVSNHGACEQCGENLLRQDYFQRHLVKCKGPPTKVKTRMNIEEEPRVENDESSTSESAFRGMINTRHGE